MVTLSGYVIKPKVVTILFLPFIRKLISFAVPLYPLFFLL